MEFDFEAMSSRDCYKLLTGVVVPRPIAWVTTLNENGVVNAAPFSFFNVLGSDPPIIAFAPNDAAPDVPKDTARNVAHSGEFVVNIVDFANANAMNICATDFPSGISEITAAGLTTAPSVKIAVPRIAESPVSLECRAHTTLRIGKNRVIIGEVLQMQIRNDLVDLEKLYVDTPNLHAVGRMHGGGGYCRTSDLFEIPRITYDEWARDEKGAGGT